METGVPRPAAGRLAITLVLLAVAGCSQPANTADMHLQLNGHPCYFPYRFILDGKRWERSAEGPEELNSQLICTYRSTTDEWVRLSYLPREEKALWYIEEYERDPQGKMLQKHKRRDMFISDLGLILDYVHERAILHGPTKHFYPNGNLKLEGYANMSVPYGSASGYYEDGTRCWIGEFRNGGILPEETRCFDRDGEELTDLTANEVLEHYEKWVELDAAGEALPLKKLLKRLKL